MRDQLCRAAVSVMSNIAEGFSRRTDKEFAHFLDIARGSCGEVQSLLYVALDVEYVSQPVFQQLFSSASATAALIHGFASYLRGERQQSDADSRRPDVDSR